ncbi:MAG: two-component regulator propeller domain-containing protein, partial [Bacteroidota bacterium]
PHLLSLFLVCPSLFSQAHFYLYDQFDKTCGLTAEVTCMAQDSNGFLWLGSGQGLFRFDGVQATKVHYFPADSLNERALDIRALCFDAHRNLLWIGTHLGIFKYNLRTGSFSHLQSKDFFEEKDLKDNTAFAIHADRQGEVWAVFGVYGLVRLPESGRKAERFFLPLTEKEIAAGINWKLANSILTITQDLKNDNILWLTTRRGLLKFDKVSKQLERHVYFQKNIKMQEDANAMMCLHAHPNGLLYIGTWDGGLLKFDPETGSFSQFFRTEQGWKESFHHEWVERLVPGEASNLWTGGTGGGSLFDVKNERFISPPAKDFHLDFKDRLGNYWQINPGLRLYHRLKNQLELHTIPSFVQCEGQNEIPFDSAAREIFHRASCKGGFWAVHVDSLTWRQYPLPGREGEYLDLKGYGASPAGFFIIDDKDRLYYRAKGERQFKRLPVQFPPNVGNLNLAARSDGHVFVTGNFGWLFWLKPGTWEMKTYRKGKLGEPEPGFFDRASQPCFDHQGRLWMRTSGGFSIFSPAEERFSHVPIKSPKGRQVEEFWTFSFDNQGKMWTSGYDSFGWFDPERPEEGVKKFFDDRSSFPVSFTLIVFYEGKKVWLQTLVGLVELDPETGKYRIFNFLRTSDRNITALGAGKAAAF